MDTSVRVVLSVAPTRQDLIQGLFYSGDLGVGWSWSETHVLLDIGSVGTMWTMLAFVKSPGTYARWPGYEHSSHRLDTQFIHDKSELF